MGSIAGYPPDFCWEDGLVTTQIEWWMGACSLIPHIERLAVVSKDNLLAQWEANISVDWVWQDTRIFVTNQVNDSLVWEESLPLHSSPTMAWSPDGRYLFVDDQAAESPIWRISADGQETVTLLPGSTLLGMVPQWETLLPWPPYISPDGKWRATSELTHGIPPDENGVEQFPNDYMVKMIVEGTDGSQMWTAVEEHRPWALGLTYPTPVRWSADGRFFYFANVPVPDGCSAFVNGGDLWQLDLENGVVTEVAPYIGLVMALSPDETQLAVNASFGRGFLIRDLTSGEEQPVALPEPADFWQMGGLQWSPDGRHLLLIQVVDPCSNDAKTAIVRVDLADLSAMTILESDERSFTLLDWVAEGEVRLLDKDGYIWYLEVFSGEMTQSRSITPGL
jgi:hypothetical protein